MDTECLSVIQDNVSSQISPILCSLPGNEGGLEASSHSIQDDSNRNQHGRLHSTSHSQVLRMKEPWITSADIQDIFLFQETPKSNHGIILGRTESSNQSEAVRPL